MNQVRTVITRQKHALAHFGTLQPPNRPLPHALILQSLKDPISLRQVHAQILTSGLSNSIPLSNRLVNSYSCFGLVFDAVKIFNLMPNKNVFSWTILISGFTRNDLFGDAIDAFSTMLTVGLLPNEVTIASILPAFSKLGSHHVGKSVHCFWMRHDFQHNVVVETSLIKMYCQFGHVGAARKLFDQMLDRNVVSWNVIISGYADNGCGNEAICAFNLMRAADGVSVDYFTIMSLLSACLRAEYLGTGRVIHGYIVRSGYMDEQRIKTALINIYICSNFISDAYSVFKETPVKDIVAWTLMLAGFSNRDYWNKAIEHFTEMRATHDMVLDSVVLVGILSSCSNSGALLWGRNIHGLVVKMGFSNDAFVGSALINMYGNCGDLENAKHFFGEIEERDVACWNAVISACGMNGQGDVAVDLFLQMKGSGANPNQSTFVSVLCACSHSGLVNEGLHIFNHMVERWGVNPSLQHYACVVDLLGRSGQMDDAHSLITNMSLLPHSEVYGSLLSACRVYGNIKMGANIFQELLKLGSVDAGHFSSLSNIYASVENWDGVETTLVLQKLKGVKRDPGHCLIEVNHDA
ncbi:hypothetical protein Ancab_018156 [Ancistrocladus abbreviatus]